MGAWRREKHFHLVHTIHCSSKKMPPNLYVILFHVCSDNIFSSWARTLRLPSRGSHHTRKKHHIGAKSQFHHYSPPLYTSKCVIHDHVTMLLFFTSPIKRHEMNLPICLLFASSRPKGQKSRKHPIWHIPSTWVMNYIKKLMLLTKNTSSFKMPAYIVAFEHSSQVGQDSALAAPLLPPPKTSVSCIWATTLLISHSHALLALHHYHWVLISRISWRRSSFSIFRRNLKISQICKQTHNNWRIVGCKCFVNW